MLDPPSSAVKIVSGGQTGVDRAALDFAIAKGVRHGGWCPRGRRAEDGPLPEIYRLSETPSRNYSQRTRWNVRDSDATVVFIAKHPLTGGTKLTAEIAEQLGKPYLCLCGEDFSADEAAQQLREFLVGRDIATLNIAGPRQSQDPDAAQFAVDVLTRAFAT